MNYNNIYTRGYLVANETVDSPLLVDWCRREIGGYLFYLESKTDINVWTINKKSVVIIGLATDIVDEKLNSQAISKNACQLYEIEGSDKAIEYIAYLGGRFIAFLIDSGKELQVIPDCHATYACYYSQTKRTLFASHVNLLAGLENKSINETARNIVNSADYVSPGGKYYPALLLPYEGCDNIFPNNKLVNRFANNEVSSERFYPFVGKEPLQRVLNESLVQEFNRILGSNIRAIVKDRNFHISLTGGNDSGVTLASILRERLQLQASAFTYFNSSKAEAMAEDVFEASRRAYNAKIPHKIVELQPLDISSEFHAMYSKSFRLGARFPSLAKAYYEDLPHDILSLVSTCSETGTVFYTDRRCKDITPECLAGKFTTSKVKSEKAILESFERYIEQTMFTKEKLAGLDFYDVFYWEHRNAKWASLWYSEADLSHFTVVPFNSRGLIEIMLSLPLEQRASKQLLHESMKTL